MSGLSVDAKLGMSLDDVMDKEKKEKRGNQKPRYGNQGQQQQQQQQQQRGRGNNNYNRGRDNRYMRNNNNNRNNRRNNSAPYQRPNSHSNEPRPSADDMWVHDKFDGKQQKRTNTNVVMSNANSTDGPVKLEFEGLPFDVLQEDVKDIFSSYGSCDVKLFFDKADRSEGKGFVVFNDRGEGEKAMGELDGALVNKCNLVVRLGPNNGVVGRRNNRNNNNNNNGKQEKEALVISVNNDRMVGGGEMSKKGRGPFRYGQ